ncbi:MAG TPA: hypothetical protein VF896_16830 [Anaerolineales bacterium]
MPRFVHPHWIGLILLAIELAACTQVQPINNGIAQPSTTSPTISTSILDPNTCLTNPPVTFAGPQGEQLQGGLVGEGETGVVLSNDSGNRACGWGYLIPLLVNSKFRVLVYQYGNQSPINELLAAVHFLAAQQGVQNLILIGASKGAEATVIVSGQNLPMVVAAVSLSADESIGGVNPEISAAKLEIPILFFTAQGDVFKSYETAQSLYDLVPSKDKHLVVIPGSLHGVDLLSNESIRAQIIDFVKAHR